MIESEKTKKNKFICYIFAYISGYIYTYSLAPFSFWILAIISPLLLLTIFSIYRNKFLFIAYCYGAGYFAAGGWIWHSIMDHTPCGYIWSTIITVIFTLILAISFLPLGFIQKIVAKRHMALSCITFPLAWLLCEALRTYSSFAYPWLMIGYSQTNSPIISLLPYVGPYLFSFIIVLISSLVWGLFNIQEKYIKAILAVLIIGIASLAMLMTNNYIWSKNKKLTMTVIQGNIAPEDKWQENQLATIINMYKDIIEQHNNTNSLFLLPETAIPFVPKALNHNFEELTNTLTRSNSAAIIGTFDYNQASKSIYNAAITLGKATGKLQKTKLVAFGEVTPAIPGLNFIIKKLSLPMLTLAAGPSQQQLLEFNNHKIAVFICYEIAFPAEVIARSQGADILVVLSDNAWFGNSSASYQHRQIAQFYAHYLQKPIIYVNNNGLSSVINSSGDVLKSLGLGKRDFFTYELSY
jgi:apolipoprotein N-acyltransferase